MREATEREWSFRRRWYEAHRARMRADEEFLEGRLADRRSFLDSAAEALALRDELLRGGDAEAFRDGLQAWAVKPGTLAFNGFSGQMMVNQLVKRAEDHASLARILGQSLLAPRDLDEATTRLGALVEYVDAIRVGAHPAPGRLPFLCSYFWALEQPDRWPVIWSSEEAFVEYCTGETLPSGPAPRYARFVELVRALDDDVAEVEHTGAWFEERNPAILDPVLADRCALVLTGDATDEERRANEEALDRVASRLGQVLADQVSAASGRTLSAKRPSRTGDRSGLTTGVRVEWITKDHGGLGILLQITPDGAAVGLRPGRVRPGWFAEARPVVERAGLEGFELVDEPGEADGFTYVRRIPREELSKVEVPALVTSAAVALQPVLDELVHLSTGEEPPADDDPLLPFVEEFRRQGYPTPADEEHKADRARFAAMLAPDAIGLADPAELRQIWNTRRYGSPGPQANFNRSLRDADAAEYDRILDVLTYLCWGEGDDASRIDEVLSGGERSVSGLGEAVIMKLLAICRPDRFIPVYPMSGPKGKLHMIRLLGLEEPVSETRGQLQVAANDLIRERLDRLFPGDPWGMGQFLYRYAERQVEPEADVPDVDPLDELAEELLIDRSFIDEIVSLLEDKGQVILYGPPGTGKTYLARRLADALVPDPTRRSLVQFHPSTSYEDFFEGYRPEADVDGGMTYRLTPGPLALLAARAADAPGKRHIMIIDEINRANLPRVFGELLFLLEYRNEQVRTLYRPDDAFELPEDLWFIGTMNTADRSIALVDAALRRRFHFVPVFPNRGPTEGLLERWLARHGEPAWVGEFVAQVNDELIEALGGPHLQIGPSHFMKRELDEEKVRRIWAYNIEPFIEDQFFGDPAQIERFRFDTAYRRFRSEAGYDLLEATTEQPGDGANALSAE